MAGMRALSVAWAVSLCSNQRRESKIESSSRRYSARARSFLHYHGPGACQTLTIPKRGAVTSVWRRRPRRRVDDCVTAGLGRMRRRASVEAAVSAAVPIRAGGTPATTGLSFAAANLRSTVGDRRYRFTGRSCPIFPPAPCLFCDR